MAVEARMQNWGKAYGLAPQEGFLFLIGKSYPPGYTSST